MSSSTRDQLSKKLGEMASLMYIVLWIHLGILIISACITILQFLADFIGLPIQGAYTLIGIYLIFGPSMLLYSSITAATFFRGRTRYLERKSRVGIIYIIESFFSIAAGVFSLIFFDGLSSGGIHESVWICFGVLISLFGVLSMVVGILQTIKWKKSLKQKRDSS